METLRPCETSWQVRPASNERYMPDAEAMQRLARANPDEAPPLQLVRSRYGLSLAFSDGKLVNPKLRDLKRFGIRSCRLKDPLSLEHQPALGDYLRITHSPFTGEIWVKQFLGARTKGFAGPLTKGFDWASMRWVGELITTRSPLPDGTVIQTQGAVRVLVAGTTVMGKLRGEKSILD